MHALSCTALNAAGRHCVCLSPRSYWQHLKEKLSWPQWHLASLSTLAIDCLLKQYSACLAGTAGAARALWQRIEQELGWSWQHLVSLSGWPFVETLYRTFRHDIPETFGSRETLLRSLRQVSSHAISPRLSQLTSGRALSSSLLLGHVLGLQLAAEPVVHAAKSLLLGPMLVCELSCHLAILWPAKVDHSSKGCLPCTFRREAGCSGTGGL